VEETRHSDDEGQPAHTQWRDWAGDELATSMCALEPHREDATRSHGGPERGFAVPELSVGKHEAWPVLHGTSNNHSQQCWVGRGSWSEQQRQDRSDPVDITDGDEKHVATVA